MWIGSVETALSLDILVHELLSVCHALVGVSTSIPLVGALAFGPRIAHGLPRSVERGRNDQTSSFVSGRWKVRRATRRALRDVFGLLMCSIFDVFDFSWLV